MKDAVESGDNSLIVYNAGTGKKCQRTEKPKKPHIFYCDNYQLMTTVTH